MNASLWLRSSRRPRSLLLALLLAPLPAAAIATGTIPAPPIELPPEASIDPASAAPEAGAATIAGPPVDSRFGRTVVERDWFAAGGDLAERADALRARIRRHGLPGFDAAARALVLSGGGRPTLVRARAAVALAPDLPLARAALAGALWREESSAFGALRSMVSAVAALDRQIESSLVTRATLLVALAAMLGFGGFAFLGVAALATARRAAHDVGDWLPIELDARSRGLLIGALVVLPAACGQGAAGLALGCFGLVLIAGDRGWRKAAFAAAALLWLGVGPLLSAAGSAIAALDSDPVAGAVLAVETDAASDAELRRLEAAPADDWLARRALAVRARRSGDLELANARYAPLVEDAALAEASTLNGAANVRLALVDPEGAIALYSAALALDETPEVLFNLSQAYGALIRTDEQDTTLARAQQLDRDAVGALTSLPASAGDPTAVDLPLPVATLRARLLAGPAGAAVAGELRRRVAPGVLGSGSFALGVGFALAGVACVFATRRHIPARFCRECGARACPRCDAPPPGLALCRDCARLLHRTGASETQRRNERLAALRARRSRLDRVRLAISLAVPGAAGLAVDRPWLGLIGAVLFAGVILTSPVAPRPVIDPLAAGPALDWLLSSFCGVLLLAHGALIAFTRSVRSD